MTDKQYLIFSLFNLFIHLFSSGNGSTEHLEENNRCHLLSHMNSPFWSYDGGLSSMRYGSEFFPAVLVEHKQTLRREEPSLAHNYSTIKAATRIKQTFKQEKRNPSNESHSTAKATCFSHYHEWRKMQRSLSAYFPLHFYDRGVALLTDNNLANSLKWVEEICSSQSDWLLGNLQAVHVRILSCHIAAKGRIKAVIFPLWL